MNNAFLVCARARSGGARVVDKLGEREGKGCESMNKLRCNVPILQHRSFPDRP